MARTAAAPALHILLLVFTPSARAHPPGTVPVSSSGRLVHLRFSTSNARPASRLAHALEAYLPGVQSTAVMFR